METFQRRTYLTTALYVDAAAQLALTRRMESLAFNLANANTTGFLGEGLKFNSVVSTTGGGNVAFPHAGADYISLTRGAPHKTGNPLDVAIRGDVWLSIMTPAGPAYTRDGRLQIELGWGDTLDQRLSASRCGRRAIVCRRLGRRTIDRG
ncbi:MAG: flagellar hook-basal body complex protein [Rhodoblastus sp.]